MSACSMSQKIGGRWAPVIGGVADADADPLETRPFPTCYYHAELGSSRSNVRFESTYGDTPENWPLASILISSSLEPSRISDPQ